MNKAPAEAVAGALKGKYIIFSNILYLLLALLKKLFRRHIAYFP